ncbi:hypothetical protein [Sulfuricystis multivorans]|uniref:hypothetical protein n=1 Tax=Sulfuricystis multivorans TaxID=2211108 RepID=UPI000F84CA0F|nr:hypothetical protein [Sulfuricystis multivorans]
MSLANLDLFGHPVATPVVSHPARRRVISEETKRAKLVRHLELSNNLVLFDELLDYLKAPLLKNCQMPKEYQSDVGMVEIVEEDDEEAVESITIPYEAWGDVWVIDKHGLAWSKEGLLYTQVRLFWRSMEELALSNNEQEKWSVLRWIFRPAIWKYYVYDKRIGRSQCLAIHERDEPFSYHNCCIAARMDEDAVREGVRRNVPAEIIKAVERVCKFY